MRHTKYAFRLRQFQIYLILLAFTTLGLEVLWKLVGDGSDQGLVFEAAFALLAEDAREAA